MTGNERNPYQPPNADVGTEAAESRPPRPHSVDIALFLIAVIVVYEIVNFMIYWSDSGPRVRGESFTVSIAFVTVRVVLTTVSLVGIALGHNWARIVFLLMTLLVMTWLASAFHKNLSGSLGYLLSLPTLLTLTLPLVAKLTAVYLVFVPGRAWFSDSAMKTG